MDGGGTYLLISLIAFVVWAVFSIYILIKAFADGILEGVLCLFVPFYVLYYAFRKLQCAHKGLVVGIWLLAAIPGPILTVYSRVTAKADSVCKLVTKDEIESALGEAVEEPQSAELDSILGRGGACGYHTVKTPRKIVELFVTKNCESLEPIRSKPSMMTMSGIGDEAYAGGGRLFVRKGNICTVVYLEDRAGESGLTGYARLEVERDLTEKLLERVSQ